ncbi:MAG: CinA family protein [Chitinophagaceae bacterium]
MELFNDQIMRQIGELLIARKQTLAVAESVTSGAIQLGISGIKEASRFFHGGITTYNIAQKYHHLQVEPIHALETNCVSKQVAEQMAVNVARLFSGDWGIAITGYAVPVPESRDEVFAYYAISFRGKIVKSGNIHPEKDETLRVQFFYANEVCRSLEESIREVNA